MDNLLKKLNSPKAILIALVLVLLVNGFLFYYYRLSAPSDSAVEPPGSQLVEDAANISFSDDEADGSDDEEVAPLEAVGAATNIPLPGTVKFDETESSGSDSDDSDSEEESILGNVLGGVGSGAAPALTPGFGTTTAPPAPVPEPANDEGSIPREIAGTVLAPVTSVSPAGPVSNEQPENQGLFETAAAALEPISQEYVPVTPVPDFFVPDSSYIEPAPAAPVPDFLIPDFIEAPVPTTPVPDFFVPDSSYIEPAAPEMTEDTSEQSPLPPVEQSPPPPVEQSPPPPGVGQPPPSGSQQPLPPSSGSQQPSPPPSGSQQPPSGSQQPAGYQQPPPGGAQ